MNDERGSTTVFTIALMQMMVVVGVIAWGWSLLTIERQHVATAADLAAVAGADMLLAPVPSDVVDVPAWRRAAACSRAGAVASANGADLTACEVDGLDLLVQSQRSVAPFATRVLAWLGHPVQFITQRARAGP